MLVMRPKYDLDRSASTLISVPVVNFVDPVKRTVLPRERRVIEYDDEVPVVNSLADFAYRVQLAETFYDAWVQEFKADQLMRRKHREPPLTMADAADKSKSASQASGLLLPTS